MIIRTIKNPDDKTKQIHKGNLKNAILLLKKVIKENFSLKKKFLKIKTILWSTGGP